MTYKIVLDASAVVKWFVMEDEHAEMCKIRDLFLDRKLEIYEPSLLFTEFSNALRYLHGLTAADVVRALSALRSLRLNVVSDLDLLPKAIEIAYNANVTVYDALYIALANAVESKLVTYDTLLLRKFTNMAVKASQLLRELTQRRI